jgi:hypothetical protein
MIVIRNVFQCKPGQAKNLVKMMKETAASNPQMKNARILTDACAGFWTVVLETEAESLTAFEKQFAESSTPEARKAMDGYMELVTGGYREIFKVE